VIKRYFQHNIVPIPIFGNGEGRDVQEGPTPVSAVGFLSQFDVSKSAAFTPVINPQSHTQCHRHLLTISYTPPAPPPPH